MDERRVIEEVLAGRREAFAELVRLHQAKVRSLCLSLLRDPTEAEDAAQEAFVGAYRNLSRFRFRSAFATWLYRIAYRRCLDVLRSRKRRRSESLEALVAARGEGAVGAAPPEESPAQGRVELVLAALPPDYRLALTLRGQGLSYEEIGGAMGCSLDSVKARLRRARRAALEAARPHHLLGR